MGFHISHTRSHYASNCIGASVVHECTWVALSQVIHCRTTFCLAGIQWGPIAECRITVGSAVQEYWLMAGMCCIGNSYVWVICVVGPVSLLPLMVFELKRAAPCFFCSIDFQTVFKPSMLCHPSVTKELLKTTPSDIIYLTLGLTWDLYPCTHLI